MDFSSCIRSGKTRAASGGNGRQKLTTSVFVIAAATEVFNHRYRKYLGHPSFSGESNARSAICASRSPLQCSHCTLFDWRRYRLRHIRSHSHLNKASWDAQVTVQETPVTLPASKWPWRHFGHSVAARRLLISRRAADLQLEQTRRSLFSSMRLIARQPQQRNSVSLPPYLRNALMYSSGVGECP
jgi:hypothetical protein